MVRDRGAGRINRAQVARLVAKGRVPAMVQLAKQDPTTVYVVLEGERTIGRVVAPAGEPVLAAGAGTVLLMRGQIGAAA
ncbi:MAG TPA: hypothetical protein VJQ46_01235 [Gemmatimonadales bacterium]|nr:hypothetical protein [Gemmatimonadales bacterium]